MITDGNLVSWLNDRLNEGTNVEFSKHRSIELYTVHVIDMKWLRPSKTFNGQTLLDAVEKAVKGTENKKENHGN